MRVGNEFSFVRFEFKEKTPGNLPRAGDLACSVEVSCDGFQGTVDTVWFSREDIDSFLSQLKTFEETRRGLVSLSNMSTGSDHDPLRFEMRSSDELGHLAVSAEVTKISHTNAGLTPLTVSVSFPLEPEQLRVVETEFRKLFA